MPSRRNVDLQNIEMLYQENYTTDVLSLSKN